MKVCNRCLNPENHALNITFDEQGICSGCRVHTEKDQIDWNERTKSAILFNACGIREFKSKA